MKPSFALVDHIRSVDKRRIRRMFGQVSSTELANVDHGLEFFLGLGGAQSRRLVQGADI